MDEPTESDMERVGDLIHEYSALFDEALEILEIGDGKRAAMMEIKIREKWEVLSQALTVFHKYAADARGALLEERRRRRDQ